MKVGMGLNSQVLVSPAAGRDTCSYFTKDGTHLIYSSTMSGGSWCPPPVDMQFGYVWPLNKHMNIYFHNFNTGVDTQTTHFTAYTAESTLSPDGRYIIFTSAKDGDLELYRVDMQKDTWRNPERMTYSPGYDGGAYFSNDGKMLTWRANRPYGPALTDYLNLLNLGYVAPVGMQLYYMFLDGPMAKFPIQVGPLNGTNFAPFFLPDNSGLIFASNMHDPQGGNFQLYTINLDGTHLTQITNQGDFNAFPMFSFNDNSGKFKISWCSSRGAKNYGTINIFVADWNGPGQLLDPIEY